MKISLFKNRLFRVLPVLFLTIFVDVAFSGQDGVIATYKNATTPFDREKQLDAVIPFPDNTILVNIKYQGGRFWTQTRKDKIERYKCSQCHNNKEVKVTKAAEIAHGEITLIHGGNQRPLQCFTCHKKDTRDLLVTEKGVTIDMDHSYQLCGQCHFRQKKDWVGGAHGKRVGFWAGKRLVTNCTSCHNPHSPKFEKQWPSTYSLPLD